MLAFVRVLGGVDRGNADRRLPRLRCARAGAEPGGDEAGGDRGEAVPWLIGEQACACSLSRHEKLCVLPRQTCAQSTATGVEMIVNFRGQHLREVKDLTTTLVTEPASSVAFHLLPRGAAAEAGHQSV